MIETIPYYKATKRHIEILDDLFKKANDYHTNRYKRNYENFKQEWLAVSFVYENKIPVGFSLLQERDCFNYMGRLCTRYFYPAQTTKSLLNKDLKDGIRPQTIKMALQQIEVGKTFGIKDFFMSREDKKPNIIKRMHKGLTLNTDLEWHIDTINRYKVTNKNHYQWILWTGKNHLIKE